MKVSIGKLYYFIILALLLILVVAFKVVSPWFLVAVPLMLPFILKRPVPLLVTAENELPQELSETACAIMGFIAVHYDSPKMSLAYLSTMLAMTEDEIEAVFRDEMMTTFEKELDIIRSAEARRLRKTGRLSIKEVAEFVGCSSETELLEVEGRATEKKD